LFAGYYHDESVSQTQKKDGAPMTIDRKEAPTPIANVEKDVADTTIASSNLRVGSMLSEGGLSSKRASAYVNHNPNKSMTSNTGTANMSGAYSAYHNPSSKH
jgi:hypothetical protein